MAPLPLSVVDIRLPARHSTIADCLTLIPSPFSSRKYVYYLPFVASALAFTLSCIAGTSCHFLQITSHGDPITLQFGYWYYSSAVVNGTETTVANATAPNATIAVSDAGASCEMYPSSIEVDGFWHAARGFSGLATLLGGSFLVLDMLQGCTNTKRDISFQAYAKGYVVCGIAAGLSLLMLCSDVCRHNTLAEELNRGNSWLHRSAIIEFPEKCRISQGGESAIAACVLWFAAAAITATLYPVQAKPEERDHAGEAGSVATASGSSQCSHDSHETQHLRSRPTQTTELELI